MMKRLCSRTVRLFALCALALTLSGCGGSEGLGQAPQSCSADFESFRQTYVRSYCELLVRCPMDWDLFFPRHQAACESYLGMLLADGLWELHSSIKAGRSCINSFALNQCMNSLESDSCSDLWWYGPQGCDEMYVGRLPPGDACYQGEECRDGYCNFSSGCPGVCAPYAQQGESCDDWRVECQPSLECYLGTCQVPTPLPPPREGDPCEYDCDYGFYCSNANVCMPLGDQGDPCEWDWDSETDSCGPDLICLSQDQRCVPVVYTQNPGGPCLQMVGESYAACDLFEDLVCLFRGEGESGECIRLPGDGEPCAGQGQLVYPSDVPCALSLYCDPGTGLCRSDRKELGEPCAYSEECISGYCDYVSTDQSVCADPLYCD